MLADKTTKSLCFWFAVDMPYLLSIDTTRAIRTMCLDECGEEWDDVSIAKARGVFSSNLTVFPCLYHKITQSLVKPENLGHVEGMPHIRKYILHCVYDMNGYYETRSEALAALASLKHFANNVLSISKCSNFTDYLM